MAVVCVENNTAHDTSNDNPIEPPRRRTDPRTSICFIIFFIIWVVLGLGAFFEKVEIRKQEINAICSNDFESSIDLECVWKSVDINLIFALKELLILLGCFSYLLISFSILLKLIQNCAKVIAWGAIGLFCFILLCIITMTFYYGGVWMDFRVLSTFVLTTVIIFTVKYKKEIFNLSKIIEEASTVEERCRCTLVIEFIPLFITSGFFWSTSVNLIKIHHESTENSGYSLFFSLCHIINIVGWVWTSCVVLGYNCMYLTDMIATWHWSLNKNLDSKKSVERAMIIFLKHVGSIAYGSMFLPMCFIVLSSITLVVGLSIVRENKNFFRFFLLCILWMFLTDFLMFVGRIGYAITAFHGTDFYTSIKYAFKLIKKHLGKFLVTRMVSNLIFALTVVIIIGVPVSIIYIAEYDEQLLHLLSSDAEFRQREFAVMIIFMFISLTYSHVGILRTAIEAITLCSLIDSEPYDDTVPFNFSKQYSINLPNESVQHT